MHRTVNESAKLFAMASSWVGVITDGVRKMMPGGVADRLAGRTAAEATDATRREIPQSRQDSVAQDRPVSLRDSRSAI
eukprot:2002376-Prymnesium_polylepis.2